MAVNYSVMQRVKPGDPSALRKFYAIAQNNGVVNLR